MQERVDQDTGAISVLPEPIGGELEAFHLDLTRVTHCPEGERNYHVFYQLLKYCEMHPQERKNLHLDSDSWMDRIKRHEREMARLTGQDDYMELHYLSGTVRDAFPSALDEDGQPLDKDLELWEDTQAALQDLGLGPKIEGIKKLLAAILLLGEVGFVPKEKDVEGSPLTARGLDEVAELLQVNVGELLKAVAQEGGNFLPVKGAVDPLPCLFCWFSCVLFF